VHSQVISFFDSGHTVLNRLRILHIEDIALGPKPMQRMLRVVRKLIDLEELHLVNLLELENFTEVLAGSLGSIKKLRVLDLRQANLWKRNVGALVPYLANNRTVLKLDVSKGIISKINMMHLWLALHKNISICELNYSRINFFSILEMHAIDAELALNQVIVKQILPIFKGNLHGAKKLSFRGLEVPNENYPAIIKFLKMQLQL